MKSIYSKSLYLLFVGVLIFSSCENSKEHSHNEKHNHWNEEDHKAVKAAILDYVDGLYQADSTRIERSVDTTLRKIGYYYAPNKKWRDNLPMTHQQLSRLAARWNKDGDRASDKSPKEIEIYDVNTKTASAKLTAEWGVDYFHLAKVNNQWKIFNVIWQSLPNTEK